MPLYFGMKKCGGVNADINIKAGTGELPTLTTPASTSEVFDGKEYIDASGSKKTGTFTIDSELNSQEDLLTQLEAALEGKSASGDSGSSTSIDTCTVNVELTEGKVVYYTSVDDTGAVISATAVSESDSTDTLMGVAHCENVVCNSIMYIPANWINCTSGTAQRVATGEKEYWSVFRAPSVAGEICTIGY